MPAEILAPLFLILLAGMPHGAGDILIAHRIFRSNYLQLTLFLITYANPHVYLDTIILIGVISQNFNHKIFF